MPETHKYLDIADLDEGQFIGVSNGRVVTVKLKIDPASGNILKSTPNGLRVDPTDAEIEYWSGTTTNGVRPYANQYQRVRIYKKGSIGNGVARIDVSTTAARNSESVIATFPAAAPTFDMIVESVFFYPDPQGRLQSINVWMDQGSREVKVTRIPANVRITTTLSGFLRG